MTLAIATQFGLAFIATVFFSKRFYVDVIIRKYTRIKKQWPRNNGNQCYGIQVFQRYKNIYFL